MLNNKTDISSALRSAEDLLEASVGRVIPFRIVKYFTVGASGIVVNLACFELFFKLLQFSFSLALIIAILLSIATNYYLNNIWTFSQGTVRNKFSLIGLFKYNIVCFVGSAINYVVSLFTYSMYHHSLLSVVFGIIIASTWNYLLSVTVVWKTRS